MKRLSLGARIGGSFDAAVLSAMRLNFRRERERPVQDRRALMAELTAFYQALGDEFFPEPRPADPGEERHGKLPDGGEIVDLAWPSEYVPAWEPIRARLSRYERNRRAYARHFRHGDRRNTIILIHGYRGGSFFIGERAFPVRWLYQRGLDVVLFTLPFHALRHSGRPLLDSGVPPWPSANPALNNEGFGQAIYDLRALVRHLAPPKLVVAGMSLGGYTTALYATIEEIDFACPMIPVASFPELYWGHGIGSPERLRAEREGITLAMMTEAMAIHTPILRTPKIAPARMLVIAAEGDRIAPPEHADKLAAHFGCEELRFAGGHILQLGRGETFRALGRKLADLGLLDRS